ncbi:hypothetical protein EEJ88_12045 [Salmonella enterica]|uniref:Uncharacterized protein n=6 Tax=Salmonella enterica TaxID=28901 RepID=A0A5U0XCY1_SALER|nr:hypothetical protein CGL53_09350 [Salmonella enterica subsp. enterica serovar Indiana]AXD13866.1 hypothetical protein CHC58_09290 [Salmonella enterica]AXE12498.1 hypothetical protein DOE64_09390 [Salmonella enterica subsp. enterica serovar Ohio]EAA4233425.1 hypothetical protein [Salmonella enterica subsp. enterica serovar Uganda]EAA7339514.1 hypothetical protein [Salmonella enterica subsp. enterica]EAA9981395.1 hypothetical protein [Salmonella enterica subsp. enterica serovar Adelaide]EBB4
MLYVYEIFYSFILSLIDCICTPIDIVANVCTCDAEYINIKIIEYKILKWPSATLSYAPSMVNHIPAHLKLLILI